MQSIEVPWSIPSSRGTAGIDLSLKSSNGITWLSYNDPAWTSVRHRVEANAAVHGISKLLHAIAGQV
jgi:hypothetical protein